MLKSLGQMLHAVACHLQGTGEGQRVERCSLALQMLTFEVREGFTGLRELAVSVTCVQRRARAWEYSSMDLQAGTSELSGSGLKKLKLLLALETACSLGGTCQHIWAHPCLPRVDLEKLTPPHRARRLLKHIIHL